MMGHNSRVPTGGERDPGWREGVQGVSHLLLQHPHECHPFHSDAPGSYNQVENHSHGHLQQIL